jgi:hypothetical protein
MIKRMILEHEWTDGRIFITRLSAGGATAGVMLATYPFVRGHHCGVALW